MEEWRDIPGYEGIYQASTFGNIRTVDGKTTTTERHGVRHLKSRVMKGRGDNPQTGKRVSLWKEGEQKSFLVARLVAETFLGSPKEGDTVNHIDGNRFNNNVSNLEWLSLADNIRHGFDTGLYAKCQKKVVLRRGGDSIEFSSMADASLFLGRNSQYISNCVFRKKDATASNGNVYKISVISE